MQRVMVAAGLLMLVCALAACQTGGGASKAESYDPLEQQVQAQIKSRAGAEGEEYQPTDVFKAKMKELQLALAEKLLTKCVGNKTASSMEGCMRERLLAGFDHDGLAARHCPEDLALEAMFECIVVGGSGYDLAGRIDRATAEAFDWSNAEEATNQIGVKLALAQLRRCLSDGSASDPTQCVTTGMTKALGLAAEDVRACLEIADDFLVGQCIGEAYGYKYLTAGIARM